MKRILLLGLLSSLMMTSCIFPGKMVYLRDMRPEILYTLSQRPEMRIQQNDRLKITISSRTPELTAPFNVGAGGFQVSSEGDVRTTVQSTLLESGYLVNRQGDIEFPQLGSINVEGLTKQEVSNLIRNRLRDERYIPDALVTVDILNFKITVIGEVARQGTQTIQDERITLLDAIIGAGGVTTNASMDEVVVMREDRRGYRLYVNDISTVGVFASPTYYLQQNDIVYVRPKTARMTERETRTWQWYNTVLSLGTTIISTLILINYFNNR